MTIDEAIAHAREKAEENRKQHKTGCLGYIEEYYDAKQRAEEQEQLAKWLEELQLYKQGNCTNDCEHFDNGVAYGYNKAIDDFEEKLSDECFEQSMTVVFENRVKADVLTLDGLTEIIFEIAQQLKDGGTDG